MLVDEGGLIPYAIIGAVIALVIAWIVRGEWADQGFVLEWIQPVFFGLVAGLGVFAFLVSTIPLFVSWIRGGPFPSWEWLVGGFQEGSMALRIASILVGAKTLSSSLGIILRDMGLVDEKDPEVGEFPEFENLTVVTRTDVANIITVAQNGIYLAVMAALWWLFASELGKGYDSLAVLVHVLVWSLFYVVDDWMIISGYSRVLKGRTFRWHQIRIWFFNLLIFGLLVTLMFNIYSWLGMSIAICVSVLLLFWRSYPLMMAKERLEWESG
jgi:hypothetical protein